MTAIQEKEAAIRTDAGKLADFIMFTQRSFLLDLSSELNRGSISFPQFFLLGSLAGGDSLTMTQIAKKMSHSTAAATGLVDRLEKLGYAERAHASGDRRKVLVRITVKGIELVNHLREGIVKNLVNLMEDPDADGPEALLQNYARLSPAGSPVN